ncbi:hypothetical protein PSH79_16930 [Pseudomonas sp. FP2196]|uniref:hypothetical protein n=1 Tax=Pseudomonas sp. FP2196 TaxID=2954086 RepID=UPI0027331546|nr:hypothetical protein [Pseudomonas sp. FP2196]WLH33615.1 hypothetical protein PSH79_16930 [Pseudomonas sp. FP2196]
MISKIEIVISTGNTTKKTDLLCDNESISITASLENDKPRTYIESNFYKCFGLLRKANPHITFFCKGAKINVHPSSMSTQMSLGLKAYELEAGKEPSLADLVFIFDYEDQQLTNDPEEQRAFYLNWIKSTTKE